MEHFEENPEGLNIPLKKAKELPDFTVTAVLKRDIFSETRAGYFADNPDERIIRRVVTASPLWSRPLAWFLAKREIRGLKSVRGLSGFPQLIAVDKHGIFRSWTEGTPLHLARPNTKEFYRSGFRLLRNMRRAGVTHNDLAKPQNWLMMPDGKAAIIDFQLSSAHKRRGALYRYFSYEDFRHLIKQKKSFAHDLLTPTEKRILKRRSWPSKLWLATGKKVYNFFTKTVFNWSDGEGTGDRIQMQSPNIQAAFANEPKITGFAPAIYSLPAKGVGLYLFIETNMTDEKDIRKLLKGQKVELIQLVKKLPRRDDGSVRDDILRLIAMNELNDLSELLEREPELKDVVQPIIDNRLNFTDRRVYEYEINRNE